MQPHTNKSLPFSPELMGRMIAQIARDYGLPMPQVNYGTVLRTDAEALTALVNIQSESGDLEVTASVRYATDAADSGIIAMPSIGASVSMLNLEGQYFIFESSSLSSFKVGVQNAGLVCDGIRWQFNNGSRVLPDTEKLLAEIRKLNEQVSTIIQTLTAWAPIAGDGGAALKAAATAALQPLPKPDFNNPELVNNNILH
jgi:hypothetical protein